jgi:hypothetical protein
VIEQPGPPDPRDAPHPVTFDVPYPERLSRGLIFVKWLLVIPQAIVAYLLLQVLSLLSFVAWFVILFTGKYPQSMHQFAVGTQRWAANVGAYIFLVRDEYPPFSFEPGEYPLTLDIPYPERQSRWRLFIRWFAVIPNQIVFTFVQIAWTITMFFAWFAILITGRYPRGLFNFNVGVQRWWHRSSAYSYLLRDEYPPYSTRADARPGNEIISAIIGFPLFVAIVALYITFTVLAFAGSSETVTVDRALLDSPERIASERPSVEAGDLRITLVGMTASVTCPDGYAAPSTVCFSIDVEVAKDGWRPSFYTPHFFTVEYCASIAGDDIRESPVEVDGTDFEFFWGDGEAANTLYFPLESSTMCELEYFNGFGTISFEFR